MLLHACLSLPVLSQQYRVVAVAVVVVVVVVVVIVVDAAACLPEPSGAIAAVPKPGAGCSGSEWGAT